MEVHCRHFEAHEQGRIVDTERLRCCQLRISLQILHEAALSGGEEPE